MKLTEAEAKTKQCRAFAAAMIPSTKTGHVMQPGQTEHISYGFSMCIGSACCHWRFSALIGPSNPSPETAAAIAEHRLGWCGMAGKPE